MHLLANDDCFSELSAILSHGLENRPAGIPKFIAVELTLKGGFMVSVNVGMPYSNNTCTYPQVTATTRCQSLKSIFLYLISRNDLSIFSNNNMAGGTRGEDDDCLSYSSTEQEVSVHDGAPATTAATATTGAALSLSQASGEGFGFYEQEINNLK